MYSVCIVNEIKKQNKNKIDGWKDFFLLFQPQCYCEMIENAKVTCQSQASSLSYLL